MSEAKHTPGPWEWVPGKRSFQGSIEPDICDFGDDTTYYPTEGAPPNLANARLIAASPCLLEALEELVDLFDGLVSGEYQPDSFTTQPARAAIAKAKGEAE